MNYCLQNPSNQRLTLYLLLDIASPDEPLFDFYADEPRFASPQFVTNLRFFAPRPKAEVKLPSPATKALPLEWILEPRKLRTLANDVLAALVQLEAHEPNLHYKADYREMFIAISLGLQGDPAPLTSASYRMFGVHPDKVYGAILARREAKLGTEYSEWYDQAGNWKADESLEDLCCHAQFTESQTLPHVTSAQCDAATTTQSATTTASSIPAEAMSSTKTAQSDSAENAKRIVSRVRPADRQSVTASAPTVINGSTNQDPTREAVLPMGITQPGGLQLTVADTDSSMGCRIESGETGVRTASGGHSTIQRRHDPENSHDSSSPANFLPSQLEKKPSDSVTRDLERKSA